MWINLKPHTPVGVLISASQVSPCAAGSIPFTCRTAIKLIFLIFCFLCTQPNNTHNLIFSSEKAFMRGNDSCWAFSMLYIILMHLDTSAGMFSGVIMCCRACESLHPAAFVFFHLLGLELLVRHVSIKFQTFRSHAFACRQDLLCFPPPVSCSLTRPCGARTHTYVDTVSI